MVQTLMGQTAIVNQDWEGPTMMANPLISPIQNNDSM